MNRPAERLPHRRQATCPAGSETGQAPKESLRAAEKKFSGAVSSWRCPASKAASISDGARFRAPSGLRSTIKPGGPFESAVPGNSWNVKQWNEPWAPKKPKEHLGHWQANTAREERWHDSWLIGHRRPFSDNLTVSCSVHAACTSIKYREIPKNKRYMVHRGEHEACALLWRSNGYTGSCRNPLSKRLHKASYSSARAASNTQLVLPNVTCLRILQRPQANRIM